MTIEDDGSSAYQQELENQEWLETIVFPYCYEPKGNRTVCCGEVHFCKVSELEND